jgi:ribosome biogenesis GTPase A
MENSAMPINWYPGHMAKTKRLLSDQIRKVDLILELCDARLPHSSRNPEINRLAGGKKHCLNGRFQINHYSSIRSRISSTSPPENSTV